ncbi:MAG: transcription termination/antitermination protein NusA [Phycisphaerales bacterium]|nr:transcription termination/antitermination protein NusA [Phycisphaerales bacterium]
MNADLVRIVDSISRDKNIEKDEVFTDLEQAMISAVRKAHGPTDEVDVQIDRLTGDITALRNGQPIDMRELGRIAAQTAKQVMIQKIREAERGSICEEFLSRKGTVVTGTIARQEGGALIVNLGRAEGFLPKSEQIPGETHHPGERIRCLILDVREAPHQVKIVLSRSHPEFIRRLFELEVPEVAERIIEIKELAREAGYRTKIAVSSIDAKVDAVGACVGVRGSRIKNIVVELGGEKIDIVRWNESSQILIGNALKPAEVTEIALCFELSRATVVVAEDQLSLAIGKRGQNVRLAARLTGWDIDILTPAEYNRNLDQLEKTLTAIEGIDSDKIAKMVALGIVSLSDVEEVGTEPLIKDLALTPEMAEQVVTIAGEAAKRVAAENAEEAARRRQLTEQEAAEAPPVEDTENAEMTAEQAEPVTDTESLEIAAEQLPAEQAPDDSAVSSETEETESKE